MVTAPESLTIVEEELFACLYGSIGIHTNPRYCVDEDYPCSYVWMLLHMVDEPNLVAKSRAVELGIYRQCQSEGHDTTAGGLTIVQGEDVAQALVMIEISTTFDFLLINDLALILSYQLSFSDIFANVESITMDFTGADQCTLGYVFLKRGICAQPLEAAVAIDRVQYDIHAAPTAEIRVTLA